MADHDHEQSSDSDSDSDEDSESDEDDDTPPFFGPFAGPSLADRRAAWKRLLGPSVDWRAGNRHGRKRRKVEMRARRGRYEHEFVEGTQEPCLRAGPFGWDESGL